MREFASDSVLLVSDAVPPAVRTLVLGACEQLGVRVAEMTKATGPLPALRADPLLVIAGLPSGCRVVPPEVGALAARHLPDVPMVLLTEEALVRSSVALNAGQLQLVGAPLSDLRVTAFLLAALRSRRLHVGAERTTESPSVIGGRVRMTEQRVGSVMVGTVTHDLPDARGPDTVVDAALGTAAVVALTPRGPAAPPILVDDEGRPLSSDGVVCATVDPHTRMLRVKVGRTDAEVRLGSPDRAPRVQQLEESPRGESVLPLESRDLVLLTWPRNAIDDGDLLPLMLDGLLPTLCGLELMSRVRPTAFAAAALQVR
jgi:hypothetical protein